MLVRHSLPLATVLFASLWSACTVQGGADGLAGASYQAVAPVPILGHPQLTTLYASDSLTSSMSLVDGSAGGLMKDY